MGVFARLLGVEVEGRHGEAAVTDGRGDRAEAEETDEANGPDRPRPRPARVRRPSTEPRRRRRPSPPVRRPARPADESVEIPKQQSAEEAADSEAGEGART